MRKNLHQYSIPFLKLFFLLNLLIISFSDVVAQVGISTTTITPDASSILELRSTTKGFLPPRLTTTERDLITTPAIGLVIYNTNTSLLNFYNGSSWQITGAGSVSSVSVVTANGFSGSVATASTTPAITISTSITGILKGNGAAISTATSGTDYSAGTSALATGILKSTTTTGALSIATAGDFPTLNQNTTGNAANVTGTVAIVNGGTNSTATPTNGGIAYGNGTSIQYSAAGTSQQVLTSNGTGVPTWKNARTIVELGGDVVNNNATANTIANVTGLSFAVTAGVTYRFKALIYYTATVTTTGSRWSVSGPVAPTFLSYTSSYGITATTQTINYASAYDIPVASNLSSNLLNIAEITGIIRPSANGTFIVRFASEIANSAITAKAGSTLEWW